MGLLDILNKAKETVIATTEKVAQTVKDNKQLNDEATSEAANWRSFDPDMLEAVLHDDFEKAANLYIKQTSCTPEKAKIVVNKIKKEVKTIYPSILRAKARAADLEAIKDRWPFGANKFKMFAFSPDKDGNITSVVLMNAQLHANGDGTYYLTQDVISRGTQNVDVIFKNDNIFFKDKSGDVTAVNKLSYFLSDENKPEKDLTVLFNPEDKLYKQFEAEVNLLKHVKSMSLFRTNDFNKYGTELKNETLKGVIDKFNFIVKDGSVQSNNISVISILTNFIFDLAEEYTELYHYNKGIYNYIDEYGVNYAYDDEDFKIQYSSFRLNAKVDEKIMEAINSRTGWNMEIVGYAGMIYEGIQQIKKKNALPAFLKGIHYSTNDDEVMFSFEVQDFLNYSYKLPYEAGFLSNSNERSYADKLQDTFRKYKKAASSGMSIMLPKFSLSLLWSWKSGTVSMVIGNMQFVGFISDVEFDESFDLSNFKPNCERHTDASLEVKEDNSIEVANEISEPSQPSGQCFDTNPDFDQETLQLLNNGMQLAAVKRYSEVNAVSLIEAMEKVDSFVKEHKF